MTWRARKMPISSTGGLLHSHLKLRGRTYGPVVAALTGPGLEEGGSAITTTRWLSGLGDPSALWNGSKVDREAIDIG